MDRFCFGVITGLALASLLVGHKVTWEFAVAVVPVYLIARYFAYKLSEG